VQHETALGLDWTALEHFDGARAPRKLNALVGRNDIELDQQVRKADVGRWLVDDDAHGAFRRVRAHVDQGAGKAFIAHARHCDKHLAVKETPPAFG
jgi:hypothetical protein